MQRERNMSSDQGERAVTHHSHVRISINDIYNKGSFTSLVSNDNDSSKTNYGASQTGNGGKGGAGVCVVRPTKSCGGDERYLFHGSGIQA